MRDASGYIDGIRKAVEAVPGIDPEHLRDCLTILNGAAYIERARCAEIITKYREQAAEVENPEERERLLLVLGLIRGEINGG